jgi:uncharacterized RDD family membrane protein YckC
MRCPKCHYVSFEPEPRCRHCGYGFSLADASRAAAQADDQAAPSLPPVPPAPAADAASRNVTRRADAGDARARARGPFATEPEWEPELMRAPAPAPNTELPLFVKAVRAAAREAAEQEADAPLVRVPVEPRPPLAVRRPVAEAPARRAVPGPVAARTQPRRLGPLDRDLLEDLQRIEQAERAGSRTIDPNSDAVGAVRRLAAATVDACIIGGLSAGVLWVTLRWLDLPLEQITTLPLAPMVAFHALVGLGYLLMFTAAGGQTIGKMLFGLRVVREREQTADLEAVTFSQAAYRVVLLLPSVLAFGAGLAPALTGGDRAFHDRLAHTRVVRA